MWSGELANIPLGWALCDGTSGTPNLLGRFVRGIDAGSSPGSSGGADQYTLSVAELPGHSHGVTDPGHAHAQAFVEYGGSINTGWFHQNEDPTKWVTLLNTVSTGTTTTGIGLQSAGGGAAFDNRPAYFEVAYIMKL